MGELVAKIQAAFDTRKRVELPIPEWGMTVYLFPTTLAQLVAIEKEQGNVMRMARTIFVRCKTIDGAPAFDQSDFDRLVTHGVGAFGPDTLTDIFVRLNKLEAEFELPDQETTQKNS